MKNEKYSDGRRNFLKTLAVLLGLPWLAKAGPVLPIGLPLAPPPVPPEPELWLAQWQAALRISVHQSDDPIERFFLHALRLNQPVSFTYWGGSEPGTIRDVRPVFLFRVDGYRSAYMTAYCHTRQEIRTFRLDRVHQPTA